MTSNYPQAAASSLQKFPEVFDRHLKPVLKRKRSARWRIGFYLTFVVPFGLVFVAITLGALILGTVDAYNFTGYLITKSGAYDFADAALNAL